MKPIIIFTFFLATFAGTTLQADEPLFFIETGACKALPGDYVLCPSRQFYDSAKQKGVEKSTFIYYAARMVTPGEQTSEVKSLAGRTFSLPNELVIPIPQEQRASVGDIVLTWWQTGSGMQRAIVVGGTEIEPVVRYLDIAFDNPTQVAQQEFRLKKDSFYVLDSPWQVGTTVVVKQDCRQLIGQLLAADSHRILVRLFGGRLQDFDRNLATPMPIRPTFDSDGAAQAALFGSLKPVTVKRVDDRIGRVFVTYQLGRTEKEKVFSFGEIRSE